MSVCANYWISREEKGLILYNYIFETWNANVNAEIQTSNHAVNESSP
jgi:hypothetical protein